LSTFYSTFPEGWGQRRRMRDEPAHAAGGPGARFGVMGSDYHGEQPHQAGHLIT